MVATSLKITVYWALAVKPVPLKVTEVPTGPVAVIKGDTAALAGVTSAPTPNNPSSAIIGKAFNSVLNLIVVFISS